VKRKDLLSRLASAAHRAEVPFVFVRHGGRHDLYRFGQVPVAVPRHREFDEQTARAIIRACERGGTP
jgi:hypothetical protein